MVFGSDSCVYARNLNIIRGQVSETFVWNVAEEWSKIEKPIFAYYLGDFDPSGLKIEASLESKLASFSAKPFTWQRLAITPDDFANRGLLGFPVKKSGQAASSQPYLEKHGRDHVASHIVNANHGMMRAAVEPGVADVVAHCVSLSA